MTLASLPGPVMGWNSWNMVRCAVTEQVVIDAAEALVRTGLRDAGYTYVVIDDCWQQPAREGGALVPHREKFPSGVRDLADRLHGLELRLGLYLTPGRLTCAEIYDRYGDGSGLGSLGRLEEDAAQLLDWGIDLVKVDWCRADRQGLTQQTEFTRLSELFAAADRDIVLSISEYGVTRPWEWAPGLAHQWRTTPDITPHWWRVLQLARRTSRVARAHPDLSRGRHDPDMLEVGNGSLIGPAAWSHLAMWAMLGAPLLLGNDLGAMTEQTRSVLSERHLIALDQDRLARAGHIVRRVPGLDEWHRETSTGPVSLLVNTWRTPRTVDLARWAGGSCVTQEGTAATPMRLRLPPRGGVLLTEPVKR